MHGAESYEPDDFQQAGRAHLELERAKDKRALANHIRQGEAAMGADAFEKLKKLAEDHALKQVPGQKIGCVRFEKPGLSVETCNLVDFTVVRANEHGSTQQECPTLTDVAKSLGSL
jgi:hypothetical protein